MSTLSNPFEDDKREFGNASSPYQTENVRADGIGFKRHTGRNGEHEDPIKHIANPSITTSYSQRRDFLGLGMYKRFKENEGSQA